jgi:predicted amidohydrolase
MEDKKGGRYMTVRLVGRGRLGDLQDTCEITEELTLCSFDCMGTVSYEQELKGESNFFETATRLSKQTKGVVVCGCVTDTRGMKRKSALVAENGRLIGVSDMTHAVDGEVSCGAGLRVYDTKLGRIGVAVAEDIAFAQVVDCLVACGSDFILCPYTHVRDMATQLLARAYAYLYGVPIVLCGVGYSMIVEADGNLAFATPQNTAVFSLDLQKEYHLVETRRRGLLHFHG